MNKMKIKNAKSVMLVNANTTRGSPISPVPPLLTLCLAVMSWEARNDSVVLEGSRKMRPPGSYWK